MNKGKYVFSQVMTYFPRWVFEAAVEKYNGDFHAKNLNSYSHCLHLMFGQLAGCKSLKDITLVLRSIKKAVYHLGIPTVVDPSSLSKANEVRDYRIFEELGMWLIRKVRPMYATEDVPDAYLPGWEIFAIEASQKAAGKSFKSLEELGLKEGMKATSSEILGYGEQFLGKGYKEVSPGRFVSADGKRVFRIRDSDLIGHRGGPPHANFETMVPNPIKPGKDKVDLNYHIYITE